MFFSSSAIKIFMDDFPGPREIQGNSGTAAGLILQPQLSACRPDKAVGDRQTDPRSGRFSRIERIHGLPQTFGGEAQAGIEDFHTDPAGPRPRQSKGWTGIRSAFHGVFDQVLHDRPQTVGVEFDQERNRSLEGYIDGNGKPFPQRQGHLGEVETLHLTLGILEKIPNPGDQTAHTPGFLLNDRHFSDRLSL